MDLSTLDLNALPVWIVAAAIILFLLPGILKGLAPFIPPLGSLLESHKLRVESQAEREETALHWKLESNGLRLGRELAGWERMLDILENSLERMWDDRVSSEANYEALAKEFRDLRYQVVRMGDTLGLHSVNVAKVTDEVERLRSRMGQLPEQVQSMGALLIDDE